MQSHSLSLPQAQRSHNVGLNARVIGFSCAGDHSIDPWRRGRAQPQPAVPRKPGTAHPNGQASVLVSDGTFEWEIEVFFKQIKQTLQLADFLGPQRQGGTLPGPDGLADLRAAAIPQLPREMGAQFHAALHPVAGAVVGKTRFNQTAGRQWDSRRQLPLSDAIGTSPFSRFLNPPMGPHKTLKPLHPTYTPDWKNQKLTLLETPIKPLKFTLQRQIHPSWDGCAFMG